MKEARTVMHLQNVDLVAGHPICDAVRTDDDLTNTRVREAPHDAAGLREITKPLRRGDEANDEPHGCRGIVC